MPPCGAIRLMWQNFCEINRFKLLESKNIVVYVDSANKTIRLLMQALYIFKFAK